MSNRLHALDRVVVSTTRGVTFLCVIATLLCVSPLGVKTVCAQNDTLSRTKYTDGASVRRVFGDVVADANRWTVRVKSGDDVVAYGLIATPDGHIVTKASQLAGELSCRLADGRDFPAKYVGYNADHDVALLEIDAGIVPAVQWQDDNDPSVGRWVITPDQQGAPNGVGIVSVARRHVPRLKEPAILGIRMMMNESPVKIDHVAEDSAAQRAQLKPGDIIHQVDDVPIASPGALKYEISRRSPGDSIVLIIDRDGEELTLRATLTHPFGDFQSRIAMQDRMGGDLSSRRNGFPVVLQHDTVLTPEQCGGPLVDLSGRAIGLNIARAGRTTSYAIPDDILRPLIDDLIAGKYPIPGDTEPTVAGVGPAKDDQPESDTARQ